VVATVNNYDSVYDLHVHISHPKHNKLWKQVFRKNDRQLNCEPAWTENRTQNHAKLSTCSRQNPRLSPPTHRLSVVRDGVWLFELSGVRLLEKVEGARQQRLVRLSHPAVLAPERARHGNVVSGNITYTFNFLFIRRSVKFHTESVE
jgi:hypothetical protein